jgi:protoporphyrinogen oxidase
VSRTQAAAEPNDVDVLVVGGGPCGLTTALEAARRGLSVELVEAAPELGGMAASFTIAGQRVDYGSHRLHPAISERGRALLAELLGSDLQTRRRNGRLRLRGRWVAFPFRPLDLATNVRPSFAASALMDLAARPFRRVPEESYADVIRSGLGPTALRDFHGPMAHKLWGLPPTRLSAELAHKRISVRTPGALARRVAAPSSGRTFLYPRLGYGQIVDRLAVAAGEAGATVRTRTRVDALDVSGPRPVAELSSGRHTRATRVMWTASPGNLAGAVRGRHVPPSTLDSVPVRALVLVYLVVPTGRYTPYDAHYVPDIDVAFSRLSEPRNYRSGPDPDDRTVLCAEIPCTEGDELWTSDSRSLAELALEGIRRCDLPPLTVQEVEVRRLPSVYPVLTVGDADARERALDRTEGIEGVTALGRQGLLVADNLHHVIDMAQSAVDCIDASGGWSDEAWERQRARFEGFVVED